MNNKKYLAIVIAALAASSTAVVAGTNGTDLNNNLLPATGGMGGASVARTVEPAAAVFGNPANLTQYNEGTSFTFGATYFDHNVEGNASAAFGGADIKSQTNPYLVPTIAITQAFSENLVAGLGLSVTAGLGADFRGEGIGDPLSELIVFNANVGAGYKVTENLSLGAMATIGNGYFQASTNENSGSTHNFGFRATVGGKYDMGATSFGAYYRSELKIRYDNYISDGAGNFWDDHVAQPAEIAFGVANNSLMGGALQVNADVIHKDYSGAAFYKDFYRDQTVFNLGAQLTTGKAQWRVGYSHARDPIKRNLDPGNIGIGGNDPIQTPSAFVPLFGPQLPVTGPVVEYFQATNAAAVWENTVTAGMGYQLMPNIKVDIHAAFSLDNEEDIGTANSALGDNVWTIEASAWQAGLGLTWSFK
jgi:long-chain fatty acid transport protein